MTADAQSQLPKSGLRKLLEANPFYLLSPLLMIIGVDMLWRDVGMLSDSEHLEMNMLSIHLYELLLVGGAILLARKRIWYDATLLVTIECAFIFVPSVLLSSSDRFGVNECAAVAGIGLIATLVKFGFLRWAFRGMMMSASFLVLAFALLAFNLLLPVTFVKMGGDVWAAPEAALEFLEMLWLFVLPLLVVAANVMRVKDHDEDAPLPARNWLPYYLYAILMLVTAYHLWALGYMRDWAEWTPLLLVPTAWALSWTAVNLRNKIFPVGPQADSLAWLPLAVFALAFSPRMEAVAWGMMLINVVIFGARAYLRHSRADSVKFSVAVLATIGMLPTELMKLLLESFTRVMALEWAAGLAVLVFALWSRRAIPGLAAAFMVCCFFDTLGCSVHVSAQFAFVFAIIHSMCWDDPGERLKRMDALRALVTIAWVASTLTWLHFEGGWWPVGGNITLALAVFGASGIYLMWTTYDPPRMIVYAAVGNLVLHPVYPVMDMVMESGPAVWMLAAAFLFFALGTVWALKKDDWMRPKPKGPTPLPSKPKLVPLGS